MSKHLLGRAVVLVMFAIVGSCAAQHSEFLDAPYYNTGIAPEDVASGDLNGDGHPDLVTTSSFAANISVFLNKGDGTFQPRQTYLTDYRPYKVVLRDINKDGNLDALITVGANLGLDLLLGNGDGTFQPKSHPVPGSDHYPHLGGRPELRRQPRHRRPNRHDA